MNTQATAGKNDNVDKKFNDIKPHLQEITSHVLEGQKHLQNHNKSVFDALGSTLDLGYLFAEKRKEDDDVNREFFKDFLEAHGTRWTAKCETSFFHGLVSVAFNQVEPKTQKSLNSAPTLSRYRAVLRFAFERGLTGAQLVSKLRAVTLDTYYSEAISHFRYDPLDSYVEEDGDRFLRSVRHLNRKKMPKIAYSEDFEKPNSVGGFATALVRVRNGSMQLVGFTDDTDGDEDAMRAKVSSLVPAEAKRRRKKLSDKNLYWLYVTCDFYRRFLPGIADRRAWAKASEEANIPIIDANSTDDEIYRSIQRRVETGKEQTAHQKSVLEALDAEKTPESMMKKFAFLDALEFVGHDDRWIARTLTTHPNTPCITVSLPDKARTMLPSHLGILGIEAQRFVGEFPKFDDWRFTRRAKMGTLVDTAGKTASTKFQDLRGLASWKTTDPQLTPVASFKLDRDTLHDLELWRAEYADIPRIGRKAFQSVMKLDIVSGDLKLIHPLDEEHQKTLGVSVTGPLAGLVETRFFDFKTCEKLIELALDYGISFEFELMEGHQGASALRFRPIDFPIEASVVLPLMLSNKGNPVEITASAI